MMARRFEAAINIAIEIPFPTPRTHGRLEFKWGSQYRPALASHTDH